VRTLSGTGTAASGIFTFASVTRSSHPVVAARHQGIVALMGVSAERELAPLPTSR